MCFLIGATGPGITTTGEDGGLKSGSFGGLEDEGERFSGKVGGVVCFFLK